jgi:hypothetical protein
MKALLAACLIALAAPAFAQDAPPPEPDPAALAMAHDIIEMTHAVDNVKAGLDLMTPLIVAQLKRDKADIPDDIIAKFTVTLREELASDIPELLDAEAKIYARHYTLAELSALRDFYRSDVGKKIIVEGPLIAKETVPLSAAWGFKAGQQAMIHTLEKLRSQGVKI